MRFIQNSFANDDDDDDDDKIKSKTLRRNAKLYS